MEVERQRLDVLGKSPRNPNRDPQLSTLSSQISALNSQLSTRSPKTWRGVGVGSTHEGGTREIRHLGQAPSLDPCACPPPKLSCQYHARALETSIFDVFKRKSPESRPGQGPSPDPCACHPHQSCQYHVRGLDIHFRLVQR